MIEFIAGAAVAAVLLDESKSPVRSEKEKNEMAYCRKFMFSVGPGQYCICGKH